MLLASAYLLYRFKHAFSKSTQHNIRYICVLMTLSNLINFLLKVTVGIKAAGNAGVHGHLYNLRTIKSIALPILLSNVWLLMWYLSSKKNGEYNPP